MFAHHSPCPGAQYHSCFQSCCVFLPACSNRAAATFQTAVASSFRPLQRKCVHSHISGRWWDVVQLFVQLSSCLSHLHLLRKQRRAQSWSGVRRNAKGPSPPPLLVVFLCSHNLSACKRKEQRSWALPWALWVLLLGDPILQESLAPAMSMGQLKADMGATVSCTKAEFQQTISEQGSHPEPCTGSCTGADSSCKQHLLSPAIPPYSFLPHLHLLSSIPGGARAPPLSSLRAGALHSDSNEFAFPSPYSQIWTIRHALALISFVLGFLEPFCGIAGEGFSFSSPVSCSLNKPGWRKKTAGRVLNAAEK